MAALKVICPDDGEVLILHARSGVVIDDDEGVYRFTCPECNQPIAKPCPDEIRELLLSAAVPTVEELTTDFATLLTDDRYIARALLG